MSCSPGEYAGGKTLRTSRAPRCARFVKSLAVPLRAVDGHRHAGPERGPHAVHRGDGHPDAAVARRVGRHGGHAVHGVTTVEVVRAVQRAEWPGLPAVVAGVDLEAAGRRDRLSPPALRVVPLPAACRRVDDALDGSVTDV